MNNLDDLQKASRLGDVQMLRKVLATSSDLIDEIDSKLGWAPIYRTVICGHYEATEFLLKSGADPDIQNRLGETALHQAADSNQLKIAQCLLKYKANTNVKQNDGETALHHCSSKGHLKMVKLLLKHKADPNIQNLTYGKTCLHYAADNGNLAIVQALLSYQAKTDIPDRNNKLPIDYAQNLDIIEALAANSSIEPKNLFNEDIPPATFKVPGLKEFPIVNESNEELVEFFAENTQKILEKDEVVVMFNSESLLEPESERISINSTPQERHFSFGGDLNKNALYKWLVTNRLEPLFQPFLLNGYDDMDFIHQIMRSSEPLSLRHLEEIGIKKPGHRVRVLALLEDEILRMRKSLAINPGFNCCVAPAATNYHSVFYQTISMQNWLEALQLGFLSRDFVNSGYDDMEHMLMLMNSSYPITEDVLKNDIKIDKLGYRHRILTKLKEDSNPQRHRKFQTNLQIDKTSQNSACEFCVII